MESVAAQATPTTGAAASLNFKLILALSMFGLAMSIATVFLIPSSVEPIFWLVIFLVCAYVIAKRAPSKFFLHGLLVSLANSVASFLSNAALISGSSSRLSFASV